MMSTDRIFKLILLSLAMTCLVSSTAEAQTAAPQPHAVQVHVGALGALDAPSRLAAVRALGGLRAVSAVGNLTRVLQSDPSVDVRAACVEALTMIGTPEARAAIANAAQSDTDPRIRQLAGGSATAVAAPVAPALQPQPAAQPVAVAAPAPTPAPARGGGGGRTRGFGSLMGGIGLLAISAVPFGIGGGINEHWEGCEWDEDTYVCGHTGAYVTSMVLFGLGGVLALAGLVLIPVGAVRLSRTADYARRPTLRLAAISPYVAPSRDGGAIFGVSGLMF